jgi:hypothetical protein
LAVAIKTAIESQTGLGGSVSGQMLTPELQVVKRALPGVLHRFYARERKERCYESKK